MKSGVERDWLFGSLLVSVSIRLSVERCGQEEGAHLLPCADPVLVCLQSETPEEVTA